MRNDVGEREIGGLTYRAYEAIDLEISQHPWKGFYTYEAPDETITALPSHWISCGNPFESVAGTSGFRYCHVVVWLEDDLKAQFYIIATDATGPIRLDGMPILAADIMAFVEVADVTDRVDSYRGVLNIIE